MHIRPLAFRIKSGDRRRSGPAVPATRSAPLEFRLLHVEKARY